MSGIAPSHRDDFLPSMHISSVSAESGDVRMLSSEEVSRSVFLTQLDEGLWIDILTSYLDFKSLVNFAVALASSKTNRVLPRFTLRELCIHVHDGEKVSMPSLAILRQTFHIQGMRFNFVQKRSSSSRLNHRTATKWNEDDSSSKLRHRSGGSFWEAHPHGSPRLTRGISSRRCKEFSFYNTEQAMRCTIRRIPFIIAALDEVEKVTFELAQNIKIFQLADVLINTAAAFQSGFCSRLHYIKIPRLNQLVGGRDRLQSLNIRMLMDAAADDVFPQGYHPFDNLFAIEASASTSSRHVTPRTKQERDLDAAIEQLYYLLPSKDARRIFAHQLFLENS